MSEITSAAKDRLHQLESEIIEHWNRVEDHYDQTITFANQAVVHAWEVGKRLIEVKTMLGHGHFGAWMEDRKIPARTAQRYMQLAVKYDNIVVFESLANKREAYLAIGLLPPKEAVEHQGNVRLKAPKHHLQFVNRWSNWWNQVKIGKVQYDPEQAKTDLKPLYLWMKELYGE